MGSTTIGYRYFLGVQVALCHGAVDSIKKLIVGEREAWKGDISSSGEVYVNAPELFGGEKSQGGVAGAMKVMMGEVGQGQDSYLREHCGTNVPAYLGLTTVLFRKFYWSAMNPYFKAPWLEVTRVKKGWRDNAVWYPETSEIVRSEGQTPTTVIDVGSQFEYKLVAIGQDPDLDYSNGNWTGLFGNAPFGTFAHSQNDEGFPAPNTIVDAVPQYKIWMKKRFTVADARQVVMKFKADNVLAVWLNGVKINPTADNEWVYTHIANIAPNQENLLVMSVVNTGPLQPENGIYAATYAYQQDTAKSFSDMNPAHIIYQCLTDVDWGMGYSTADLDDANFRAAALKLYNERFGLSLIWEKQMSIMQFVQIICDHINGALQLDLKTGKFKIKLIRDGYDLNTLVELNPDNILTLDSCQRMGLGELVNMMTVTYTDRNQTKQTVTVHDLATLEAQGSVVSTSREYLGIRDPELAMRVAARDLNTVSAPLAKVSLEVNRVLFDKEKGDEVLFTWPLLGINKLPMRIIDLDKGTLLDGKMRVELIEDVFGFPDNTYLKPQPPIWIDPQQPPAPSSVRKVIEVPYWEVQRELSPGDFAVFPDDGAILGTLANKPSGVSFDYGIKVAPNYDGGARGQFAPNTYLTEALAPAQTNVAIAQGNMLSDVSVGEYALIGNEIVRVDAINPLLGTMTVGRGCLDTVTTAHPINTVIFFPQDALGSDGVQYLSGQNVTVKMLPRTGQGELTLAAAPTDTVSMVGRFNRPYPPGQLRLVGSEKSVPSSTYPTDVYGTLTVTWKSRNRLVQNLEDESAGNITSEAGVTYNLRIFEGVVLLQEFLGITALSQIIAITGVKNIRVELESVRDGQVSFSKHSHSFKLINTGYILTESGLNLTTESGLKLIKEQ